MVIGLPNIHFSKGVCQGCVLGKHPQEKFEKGKAWTDSSLLELIHNDLMGPFPNPSISKVRCVLTFIDDFVQVWLASSVILLGKMLGQGPRLIFRYGYGTIRGAPTSIWFEASLMRDGKSLTWDDRILGPGPRRLSLTWDGKPLAC